MAYVFCNHCGHRNPPDSSFCSSCGSALDMQGDRTITLTAVDPLQDAPGRRRRRRHPDRRPARPTTPCSSSAPAPQAGDRFTLDGDLTRLGRHPDSEIILDDITVSRRHVAIERTDEGYVASDAGSLNGTYVNQERIDRAVLHHGDELQVGKFRLVLFERSDG